jgi:hypothetical protein
VNPARTVINLEENIGKQVGRRRPPTDPLKVADSTMLRAIAYQRAFPCPLMPRRGVYRFNSHEEADLWMRTPQKEG